MTDLIDQLRKTKTSSEVGILIPKFEQARIETQRKLDLLENSREDAILTGPAERQRIRDEVELAKNTLDDLDAALRVAERRLKQFQESETIESIKVKAKAWPADAKAEFDLRDQALKKLAEAFTVLGDYRSAREKNMSWRTTIGRADALGLKPVDPLGDILAKANRPHPVNDPALYTALQAAANFKAELEELGVKAA